MESKVWNNLPDDLLNSVLSYGDPDNTFKYSNVLDQLKYYKEEFDYYRHNKGRPENRWYNASDNEYYKYALRETFLKRNVNKYYGDLNDNFLISSFDIYNYINTHFHMINHA